VAAARAGHGLSSPVLEAAHLRDLDLDAAQHPRGLPHLSAASGLVLHEGTLFAVADDEHHLAWCALADAGPWRLHRIAAGDLPADAAARKKRKPDFEALALLPGIGPGPGTLLALGSGSRPQRHAAVLVPLGATPCALGQPRSLSLDELYAPLHKRFADLNVEGAFVEGGHLCLLQRGHKGEAVNACIRFPLPGVLAWLQGQGRAPGPERIELFELGQHGKVPFGFTDGAAIEGGGWVFSAVAEDTDDSFLDGPCAASGIGRVGPDGRLASWQLLAGAPKVEGIAVDAGGAAPRVLLVTDADDPATAARLLACRLQ